MEEEAFNRKLIDEISAKSLLYNSRHPDKKNNKIKLENIWKEIAAKLNSTVPICMSRWNNLRSTYCRKHKKNSNIPSGSATQASEQWPYFSQLSFLKGHVKHRGSSDNLVFDADFDIEPKEDSTSVACTSPPADSLQFSSESAVVLLREDSDDTVRASSTIPTAELEEPCISKRQKRKRSNDQPDLKNELFKFLQAKDQELQSFNIHRDRFDDFGNFVASELRSKKPDEVSIYMQQICQVLYAQVLEQVE